VPPCALAQCHGGSREVALLLPRGAVVRSLGYCFQSKESPVGSAAAVAEHSSGRAARDYSFGATAPTSRRLLPDLTTARCKHFHDERLAAVLARRVRAQAGPGVHVSVPREAADRDQRGSRSRCIGCACPRSEPPANIHRDVGRRMTAACPLSDHVVARRGAWLAVTVTVSHLFVTEAGSMMVAVQSPVQTVVEVQFGD